MLFNTFVRHINTHTNTDEHSLQQIFANLSCYFKLDKRFTIIFILNLWPNVLPESFYLLNWKL